ncbi:ribonuclease P protein component [Nioella sp. MMSF_3534]|uniref:ribonuclease P protein component n=1 Tax=Nioella sp. MMSF_3534 TaxID=3046720 RepID=UPI0035323B1A
MFEGPPLPIVETLTKRPDFLRAARAARAPAPAFLLQARRRREDEGVAPDLVRVGFTCSKKVGNAVARNRAKRRLREIARAILPLEGRPGWDYVLIGKANDTAARPMEDMLNDLQRALRKIHK